MSVSVQCCVSEGLCVYAMVVVCVRTMLHIYGIVCATMYVSEIVILYVVGMLCVTIIVCANVLSCV